MSTQEEESGHVSVYALTENSTDNKEKEGGGGEKCEAEDETLIHDGEKLGDTKNQTGEPRAIYVISQNALAFRDMQRYSISTIPSTRKRFGDPIVSYNPTSPSAVSRHPSTACRGLIALGRVEPADYE